MREKMNPRIKPKITVVPRRSGSFLAVLFKVFLAIVIVVTIAGCSFLSSATEKNRTASAIERQRRNASEIVSLILSESDTNQRTIPESIELSVPCLMQNPELPTGCESVALTNALLFYGFELEKTTIADKWLPLSDDDFVNSFLGNPRDPSSNSCMAPCLTQTANSFLEAQGSQLRARDISGIAFEGLLSLVGQGKPIIVWSTIDLMEVGAPYRTQIQDDITYFLFKGSHCVVISGYDHNKSLITVCDSLSGLVLYDKATFTDRYYSMGSQAIVFEERNTLS